VETLARLEAAVWGDTATGGAVRLTVEPVGKTEPVVYDYRDRRDRFRVEARFAGAHQLEAPPARTSQGLFYASYGMNDGGRPPRCYLPEGTSWTVRLMARAGCYQEHNARGQVVRRVPLGAPLLLE
jgi:hypothetical protein